MPRSFARRYDQARQRWERRTEGRSRLVELQLQETRKFLPIAVEDVFSNTTNERGDTVSRRATWTGVQSEELPELQPSPYLLSEIAVILDSDKSELRLREQGSLDVHRWMISDEHVKKVWVQDDGMTYREETFTNLPGNHIFRLELLAKFYADNSTREFDSYTMTIRELNDASQRDESETSDGVVPQMLRSELLFVKSLTLEIPNAWTSLDSSMELFLLSLNKGSLEDVHLSCSDWMFPALVFKRLFESASMYVTLSTFRNYWVLSDVPMNLNVKINGPPLSVKEFSDIVENYANPNKCAKLLAIELDERLDFFETIDFFTRKPGWKLREHNSKLAVFKDLGENILVTVYYNREEKQWVVATGIFERRELPLETSLADEIERIARMPYEERLELSESGTVFWEKDIPHLCQSVSVNFNEPELEIDGYKVPGITVAFDIKKKLAELMKNPESAVDKFKVIGNYVLFQKLPSIRISELHLEHDDVYSAAFFEPFGGGTLEKLTVSTRKILDEAQEMIVNSKQFIVLDELGEQKKDFEYDSSNVKEEEDEEIPRPIIAEPVVESEESDEEPTVAVVEQPEQSEQPEQPEQPEQLEQPEQPELPELPTIKAEPQPESSEKPESKIHPKVEVDTKDHLDLDLKPVIAKYYKSIELNFEYPEIKIDGKTLPGIDIPYDVYKMISSLASKPIEVGTLRIIGEYRLFRGIRKMKVSHLWLKNTRAYQDRFLEPFDDVELEKLTVSSEKIVEDAKDLIGRAKKFVVLDIKRGKDEEEENDEDEPTSADEEPETRRRKYYDSDAEPDSKRRKIDDSETQPGDWNTEEKDRCRSTSPPNKRSRLETDQTGPYEYAPLSRARARAPSRSLSPPIYRSRAQSPEVIFDMFLPSPMKTNRSKSHDFELSWAIAESAREHREREAARKYMEEANKKPPHYRSKDFVPQQLFVIPICGYPCSSNVDYETAEHDYKEQNHYNLSRYEVADIGPHKPRYPTRCPTPTEPYRPITPFDMKKYEDEFFKMNLHGDENSGEADAPGKVGDDKIEIDFATMDSDQPGPSGLY